MHIAITGASAGIGGALARELARWQPEARLTLVARRRAQLEALAAEIGPRCQVVVHDLSVPERATDWIGPAEAASGPIDLIVNNAGVENTGPTVRSDIDEAMRLLATNLLSPLRITHQLLPAMLARDSGTIVDIASVSALVPPPLQAWYGASKAGLGAFSEALRGELRGTRVHVLTVYPGPIDTAMSTSVFARMGGRKGALAALPMGTAEELARLVRRGIERRKSRVIYPGFYALARLLPWLSRWVADVGAPRGERRG
jgi:short-subunit dehydrogenase